MNPKSCLKILNYWFPKQPDRAVIGPKLAEFYAQNAAYHEMTRSGDKTNHPQVRLLTCLLKFCGNYAEVGCGGGDVCRVVSETAHVHGFDVSSIAVSHARQLCAGMPTKFDRSPAESLPLSDDSVDGCYSFEVLEHVWDPVAVVREMVRITKPGGFILLSIPNRFSLDLHLKKHKLVRCLDLFFAGCRYIYDRVTGVAFENIVPVFGENVYPDCDMITAVVSGNFVRAIESMDCIVDFCDTTYMCACRKDSITTLDFQRNTARPFLRNFGDHLLILAHRKHK